MDVPGLGEVRIYFSDPLPSLVRPSLSLMSQVFLELPAPVVAMFRIGVRGFRDLDGELLDPGLAVRVEGQLGPQSARHDPKLAVDQIQVWFRGEASRLRVFGGIAKSGFQHEVDVRPEPYSTLQNRRTWSGGLEPPRTAQSVLDAAKVPSGLRAKRSP